MTDLEWDILDQTYFMTDYRSIVEAIGRPIDAVNNALVALMKEGWLRQLFFSETARDFVEQDPYDPMRLQDAHYVISKQGLLSHTGTS